MNVNCDPKTGILTIGLAPGEVAGSDEDKPGVIIDYDTAGNPPGIEILDASKRIPDLTSVNPSVAV